MNFAPFLLLAAAAAVPLASPVKQGVDYWQAGDFDRATKAWMPAAQGGDADAQFNLAQAYKLGRGVPMDMRQAESWYRKAAEQNHVQAGAMLGLIMFQNGDRKNAMPWIQRAAERSDPRAQYVYGTALFNGDEVVKDWPRAYAMMTRAAAAGLPQATASLGQMDQFIPLADRQAGLRLARNAPRASVPEVRPSAAAPTLVAAAAPVRATASPPSAAATSPALPKPAPRTSPEPFRPTPKVAAPSKGGWRIQLGAFSGADAARSQWTKLSARPALRGLRSYFIPAGAVTRLQAGPFASREAAAQACRAASSAGASCFPVVG